MVLALIVIQVVVLVGAAFALGWAPGGTPALVPVAVLLGTAAFAGLGLLMAGTLRGTSPWPWPTASTWCCCCSAA